jgi:NADH-quinone oxidoreductase subunit H
MGPLSTTAFLISAVAKVLVIFVGWLIVVAGVTLAERKIAAWIQDRSGPNRVGPWGILQPIADGIKNFVKEEHIPGGASRWLFFLAPIIAMFPAFVVIAVIPVWRRPCRRPGDWSRSSWRICPSASCSCWRWRRWGSTG